MRDAYFVIVPRHIVTSAAASAETLEEALRDADALVEKDRTPRAVVMVVAETRPSQLPRLETEYFRLPEVVHA